ncbi:type II secretion system F family protein [Photobacterium sp. BZF1]|uniref:type II secretion system F family protein n=1 Tax=Photobacterium TaxID=657 RepID=UPI00165367F0|nr:MULTISPECIES: type II secretion system F family protein [Photobacterium]MBC7002117.1 type II secretion system F family protein [Photobacterium sp. BZF1]MBY5947373.1 type II secretion system F family protein [Photobacterium rosenbergii]
MSFFQYIGRNAHGDTVEGWVAADEQSIAREKLEQKRIQPLVIRKGIKQIPLKVDRESLLTSLRELASLRKSGMGLDKAVEAIAELSEDKQLKQAWKKVYEFLHNGFSLSEAMESLPFVFPRYVPSMVRLGEANGDLPQALYSIAERVEKEAELMGEIKSALTYPAFLICFSIAILLFLFSFVLPNFESMVESGNGQGSALASLLTVADFFNRNISWILPGLFISFGMIVWGFHEGKLQSVFYRIAAKLPFTRDVIAYWDIIEFSSSMSRLLGAGVDLLEGALLSAEGLSQEKVRRRLADTVKGIKQGESFSDSLRQKEVFPNLVIQMIAVGESGATLPESFQEISTLYERRMKNALKRAITLLEPSVIVVMGGLIGSIMIVLISGIISVNDIAI